MYSSWYCLDQSKYIICNNVLLFFRQNGIMYIVDSSWSSEKSMNRPAILNPAAIFEFPIFILYELFLETDIFVCAFGIPSSINILKLWASIPHHSPSSWLKLRNSYKRLLRYMSGGTHKHMDTHTQDQLLDPTLVRGPVVN